MCQGDSRETGLSVLGVRHLQTFVLFLCMAVNYLMRVNVSLAIVMMTDLHSDSGQPTFSWSMVQRSTVLSSFHIGYFFMNLCAAVLVTRFQNKTLLLFSVATSSIVTLAAPNLIVAGGFYALLAIRISLGLLQGFMMAVVMGQLSRWIPPGERSRCANLVFGGVNFGTMITFAFSGWIGGNFGWPSIFYFSGCAGVIWSVIWIIVGADSPSSCWLVGDEERVYIEKQLLLTSEVSKDMKIPWRGLFSNKACWALLLTSMGYYWGNWILLTQMPSYFNAILHLDSASNGLTSALPHGCLWLVSFVSSNISDWMIRKRILSVGACRKVFNSIGEWSVAAALLLLSYIEDRTAVVVIYTVAVTLMGFVHVGFFINFLDIVPSYAGFFMGITNGMSTITSFSGTQLAGIIISNPENKYDWHIVFFLSAGVYFISNLIFIIFGSGEVQPIGNINEKTEKKSNSETKPAYSVSCNETNTAGN